MTTEANGSKSQLNWPTVVLIALTGGGNLWATHQAEQTNTVEMERARQEVHRIHESLTDFEKYMRVSFNNQNKMLDNQTQMLQNQANILAELKAAH
jgi:predicted site-specific integrase-resolvase